MEFTGRAAQHDPSGCPHARPIVLIQRQRPDFLDGQKIVETLAPWIDSKRLDPAELVQATRLKGVLCVGHG